MKWNSHVPVPHAERQIWDQFRNDHELLERLRVTSQELEALADCVLLGTLTCKQDMLFILRQIRMATGSEETTSTPEPAPRRDEKTEVYPKEIRTVGSRRRTTSAEHIAEPATLGGIARACWLFLP